jgi:drug/metabolite transporter (DMT)-like permease
VLAGGETAMLVTLLIPISGLLLGWAVLDERLPWTVLTGMAAILAGLILIDGRLFARHRLSKG